MLSQYDRINLCRDRQWNYFIWKQQQNKTLNYCLIVTNKSINGRILYTHTNTQNIGLNGEYYFTLFILSNKMKSKFRWKNTDYKTNFISFSKVDVFE